MKYILGIDGGGTKSHVLLCNRYGEKIDYIKWGPTNQEALNNGMASLKEELLAVTNVIINNNHIKLSDIEMTAIGLSGVDTKAQYIEVSEILRNIGFSQFILCNDAYLGIFSGTDKGYGICSVNGTGCTTVGIDDLGNSIQIGGIGYLTGDCGGGYWLGTEVVSCIYKYLYKCGEYTILKDMVFDMLEIKKKSQFIEKVIECNQNRKVLITDLNKLIFIAARGNDAVALKLLDRMCIDIGSSIVSAISELSFSSNLETIPVILSGSIYTKERSTKLLNMINDYINTHTNREISLHYNKNEPVIGAINMCIDILDGNNLLMLTDLGRTQQ